MIPPQRSKGGKFVVLFLQLLVCLYVAFSAPAVWKYAWTEMTAYEAQWCGITGLLLFGANMIFQEMIEND